MRKVKHFLTVGDYFLCVLKNNNMFLCNDDEIIVVINGEISKTKKEVTVGVIYDYIELLS